MNRRYGAVLLALGALVSACTSSESEPAVATLASTTTTVPATTTTQVATSTTLSQRQLEELAIAEAEAAIADVVIGWGTFPYDSSKGEAGMPLEFLTGAMRTRYAELPAQYEAKGQYVRSLNGEPIEVIEILVDLDAGKADIDVCIAPTGEVVDSQSGEVLSVDDGVPGTAELHADLIDGEWLISEFFFSRIVGENIPCEFSD